MQTFLELLKDFGRNDLALSNTPYDSAWVARLKDVDAEMSNLALEWICEHQLADGSWGASFPFYYHDRVVCTLASMIALTYRGRAAVTRTRSTPGWPRSTRSCPAPPAGCSSSQARPSASR